jgi:hypothetical protein
MLNKNIDVTINFEDVKRKVEIITVNFQISHLDKSIKDILKNVLNSDEILG